MIELKVIGVWYLFGLIGWIWISYLDWKNGIDFKLIDIGWTFVMSLFGFIILLYAIYANCADWKWNRVLIKGKKK